MALFRQHAAMLSSEQVGGWSTAVQARSRRFLCLCSSAVCGWFQVEGGWGHTTTLLRIQTKTKGQVFPNRLLETLVISIRESTLSLV